MTEPESVESTRTSSIAEFVDLGVDAALVEALGRLNYRAPTELQRGMIPALLRGRDVLAEARTGTGKTAGYGLPILQALTPEQGPQALVLVPTRDLAQHIERTLRKFNAERPIRITVTISARRSRTGEDESAEPQPDLIIGGPHGVREFADQFRWNLSTVRLLIIDEAEDLLDGEGREDVEALLDLLAPDCQIALVATRLNEDVRAFANEMLDEFQELAAPPRADRDAALPPHRLASVTPDTLFPALLGYLKQATPKLALVFTNTPQRARVLTDELKEAGVECRQFDAPRPRDRNERDRGGRGRRHDRAEVIVAADPASRQLSGLPVSHLVHYDIPEEIGDFLARAERCTRLGRKGEILLLVTPAERDRLAPIEQRLGAKIDEVQDDWLQNLPSRPAPSAPRSAPPPQERRERGPGRERSGDSRRGPGGGRSRDAAPPPPPPPPPPPEPLPPGEQAVPARLKRVLLRDPELEARGILPLPRTLASRFPSGRTPRKPLLRSQRGIRRSDASPD